MRFKKALLAGAFLAAGIGTTAVQLTQHTLAHDQSLALKADAVVRRDGIVNIVGTRDDLRTFHSLESGNVSVYSNEKGMEITIAQILMEGDTPYIRILDLTDLNGNGTVDAVHERRIYFTPDGLVPFERNIHYIGVDFIPFHEDQKEYLAILRLLGERQIRELKKKYEHQLPKKRTLPPGVYEV